MNKKEYCRPQADLVLFANEDIITTSWWMEKCTSGIGENRADTCEYGGLAHDRLDNQVAINNCMLWKLGGEGGGTWNVKTGAEWGKDFLCGLLFEN